MTVCAYRPMPTVHARPSASDEASDNWLLGLYLGAEASLRTGGTEVETGEIAVRPSALPLGADQGWGPAHRPM